MDFDPFDPQCAACGSPVDWEYRTQSYVHTDGLYHDHAATLHQKPLTLRKTPEATV